MISVIVVPIVARFGLMPRTLPAHRLQPPRFILPVGGPAQPPRPGQPGGWRPPVGPRVTRPSRAVQSYSDRAGMNQNNSESEPRRDDALTGMAAAFNGTRMDLFSSKLLDYINGATGDMLMPISGLYTITHLKTGRVYVGQSQHIVRDIMDSLGHGRYSCKTFQYDVHFYGLKAFRLHFLAVGIEYEDDIFRKKKRVEFLATLKPKDTYNNLKRKVTFPACYSRKYGKVLPGGTFESVHEAAWATGWSISEVYRRLNSLEYPDWRDLTAEERKA